jgi:hypothetical protein
VWVDLGAVYRVGRPRRVVPGGLDLQATVPGRLAMWALTTTGHWVGYVIFHLTDGGEGGLPASQWVLASALQPRHDQPARPEQP